MGKCRSRWWWIALLILIIIGGGWYLRQSKIGNRSAAADSKTGESEQTTETKQTAAEENKTSITELFQKGNDLKCSYSSKSDESGTAEVTVYISGKKMRADSSGTSSDGVVFKSSMILNDDYLYVWTPDEKTGVKMPVAKSEADKEAWKGNATYLDPEQKVDYKCGDWVTDQTVFVLPKEIKFEDMTQVLKDQCAVCDNLSGEQKDTCKKSLGCN